MMESSVSATAPTTAPVSSVISEVPLVLSISSMATDYLLDEGPELEDGHLKAMQTARTKIEYTVPDLADRLEQGQAQEPQIDIPERWIDSRNQV